MNEIKNYNKYVISYLRDKNRNPWACLIGFNNKMYGISICNPKDKFDKLVAKELILSSDLRYDFDLTMHDYYYNNFPIKYYNKKKHEQLLLGICNLYRRCVNFYKGSK